MTKTPKKMLVCSLKSGTGSVQGKNRVYPVQEILTGKILFSLQGTPVLIAGTPVFITGISLWEFVHREIPVVIKYREWVCSVHESKIIATTNFKKE